MSENSASQHTGTSGLPPSVPPARTSVRTSTVSAPARVSASAGEGREAAVDESGHPTTERRVEPGATAPEPRAGAEPSKPARPKPPGPRRVRLAVSRVDPWSVMKLSFLLSIALGIGIVVAAATVWTVLNEMEVFSKITEVIEEAEAMNQFGTILGYFEFDRVISVAIVIAVVDIVLMTALATLGAFVYNLVAAMVGGLHLTLTDD